MWKDKVTTDFAKMKLESPAIIDPETEKTRFTTTLIAQPDAITRKKIFEIISPLAKQFSGIFIQPEEGYHFSIQWSDVVTGDIDKLTNSIDKITPQPLNVEIKLLYPSKPNLFAVLVPMNNPLWMSDIRKQATTVFMEAGFSTKLPESLPTIWMSLIRFTKEFDTSNLDELINSLPNISLTCDKFTLSLAQADPFFSKSTAKILTTKNF